MEKRIVTGQQIGLLGGPLYTTYKVLGAIYHARLTGGKPVYWLEQNDADFQEINHIDYIDAENTLRTLTWDIDSQGYSCGLIEIDDSLIAVLREFFDSLRQTEFTPALRELALRCYTPGRTLGEASLLLAQELFGRFDIELFDPSTQAFKEFMRPFLLREAEHTPPGQQCNLFCMLGKRRVAVFKTAEGRAYRLRDGTELKLEEYDLVPNFRTRPVCQDAYFTTQAYIAGPGEQQYLRELGPLYEFHGVQQAEIIPRMSLTLLEPKVARLLKKHALGLDDVLTLEKPDLMKKVLKEHSGFDYTALMEQANTLTGDYVQELKNLGVDLGKFERKIHQAIKENVGQQRAQEKARLDKTLHAAGTLSDLLMPFGRRQERVFNLFYYMNFYGGLDFLSWLYECYDPSLSILEIKL